MTTPHPTPEEWEYFCDESYFDLWCVRKVGDRTFGHGYHMQNGNEAKHLCETLNAHATAIREAEAAGEARGRAMERKEIIVRARRLRKRFGKCEGSFREEIIWGHGLRVEKMIRTRTDKENSDD